MARSVKHTRPSVAYGRSPWVDGFPRSRVPDYPRHRDDVPRDVVIIGGGLTGCTTACLLSAAGARVVLLEADRLGRGSSAASTGWIGGDPCLDFVDVDRALGLRAARHVLKSWQRSAVDFAALLRRLQVKCGLEAHPSLLLAMTPEDDVRLRREQKARKGAGIDAPLLNAAAVSREVAIGAHSGLRGRHGFTIDPYRATLGLAAAAERRGVVIFERSPVRRITFDRKLATVFTAGGAIRTRKVVVATGVPTTLFKALARHFWFRSAFLALTAPIPARIRATLGTRSTIVRDSVTPPHTVLWRDGDRLLVSGADTATPERKQNEILVQRTGQLMYELSVLYPEMSGIPPTHGWEAPYARTSDGLPFIGPHRNYPHHLFAFGDASAGVTGAYLAARIIARDVLGQADTADEVLSFNRYGHVR